MTTFHYIGLLWNVEMSSSSHSTMLIYLKKLPLDKYSTCLLQDEKGKKIHACINIHGNKETF